MLIRTVIDRGTKPPSGVIRLLFEVITYHIGKSKAVNAALRDHSSESPEYKVCIEKVGFPAICQYYCKERRKCFG